MGDEVQAIKAGLLEVADIVVVNKGDRPGAQRTASQLRAMLVPTVGAAATPTRRAPAAEAARGAAHDRADRRRRPGAARGARSAPRARPRRRDAPARLARAEAQVRAILAERLRDASRRRRWRDRAEAAMRAVAAHELDPYAAADRLLGARCGRERQARRDERSSGCSSPAPGLMGHGIAQVHAAVGKQGDALRAGSRARGGRAATGSPATSSGRSPRAGSTAENATRRWRGSRRPTTSAAAADADLVVEAVFEDLDVKRGLWATLDAHRAAPARSSPRNTSSISIDRLAAAVAEAARAAVRRHALLQPGAGDAARSS